MTSPTSRTAWAQRRTRRSLACAIGPSSDVVNPGNRPNPIRRPAPTIRTIDDFASQTGRVGVFVPFTYSHRHPPVWRRLKTCAYLAMRPGWREDRLVFPGEAHDVTQVADRVGAEAYPQVFSLRHRTVQRRGESREPPEPHSPPSTDDSYN